MIVEQMLPAIRDLARDESIAVVLVEQHVGLALAVSDRAVVLNHGRVVSKERPECSFENAIGSNPPTSVPVNSPMTRPTRRSLGARSRKPCSSETSMII